ncbi:DNA mismatch repair protein MutS [Desulfurispirillum indicum S5]|uniref:DNA mismatch repair protein MutS n=1 Tax=Desulfurispirillum indicum (strain ATCC BAA-1389 / DSM 22839 / S5) TaxID=653733 RepID=E6W0A7_DESIS|nr:DNA mismatch repair protein MutS [Desulfurispirillum indicum]ADU66325.1 DNA mismatch repair protein MutS [Desulfurispirillum indicum S5]
MSDTLTPMMRQFMEIKDQYPDAMLFFRMGDFYELFGEDAVLASEILKITLTSRDKGEKKTPMAGVPHHALEGYLYKLVKAGHKAVICDQLEDPRQAKGIVKRGVTRIVTPSTIIHHDGVDPSQHNFLAALHGDDDDICIALWDLSTASVKLLRSNREQLADDLRRYPVSEYLVCRDGLLEQGQLVQAPQQSAADFARFEHGHAMALTMASAYLEGTQLRTVRPRSIEDLSARELLLMDENTCVNLELLRNMGGGREHTLLWVLDRTRTAMGGRLLRDWMRHPLYQQHAIEQRLDAVELLAGQYTLTGSIRDTLGRIHDLERLINRISLDQHKPRDLVALRQSLRFTQELRLQAPHCADSPLLQSQFGNMEDFTSLLDLLDRAMCDEPPVTVKNGQVIRSGYDAHLDQLRDVRGNARDRILHMEAREKQATGISSLKIRYNRVFGYYIEVPKTHQNRVPAEYIRKQTLVNAERYVTEAIKELETSILEAEEQLIPYEESIYADICQQVLQWFDPIINAARSIACIDVLSTFAEVAVAYDYRKPRISPDPVLHVQGLRHPVIEKLSVEPFVANDLVLNTDDQQLMIITGPNMAGKSTYMRQAALAVIMAQMGCFVPATEALIGLCDRIFTRVGASDNLVEGKSTFMVEMSETANILHHATRNSLIVIDEVGRGTSTFDGISIAWSVAEHLSSQGPIGARTLFATHFHELTDLERELHGVVNFHILIRENHGTLHFLRKVAPGAAPKSYGIEVARLAQIPLSVIERAHEILQNLEAREYSPEGRSSVVHSQDPPFLFGAVEDPLVEKIRGLNLDECTPRQALQILYELKSEAGGSDTSRGG